MSTANDAPNVAATDNCQPGSIRLPPFSEAKPQVWFAQIEEPFVIYCISRNKLCYAHMVGALSTESYEIASVVVSGLTDNRYSTAKQALLTVHEVPGNPPYTSSR